jgi:hypothetical protein
MAAVVTDEEDNGFESAAVFFEMIDDKVERGDGMIEGTAVEATAAAKETVVSTGRERIGAPVTVAPPAPAAVVDGGVQVIGCCVDSKGWPQRLGGVGVDRDAGVGEGSLLDRTCTVSARFRIWEVEVRRFPAPP